jgi:hypothetical protein
MGQFLLYGVFSMLLGVFSREHPAVNSAGLPAIHGKWPFVNPAISNWDGAFLEKTATIHSGH